MEPSDSPDTRDLQRLVESAAPRAEPAPTPVGAQVGEYQIRGELGAGAMGTVYRAYDPRAKREVALKIPKAVGGTRIKRVSREGIAAANLNHPGIVRVYEHGVAENGIPFLVYELIEGVRTFDEVAPHLPLRERVTLVRDAARAMGHAHARGVVHRDLKPENLFVDPEGRVRVADFGIAKLIGLEALTMTGALIGTPRTMSPEQVNGEKPIGPASDVWSLGVVLYWALTGTYPFDGNSLIELAARINGGVTKPPSTLEADAAPFDSIFRRAFATTPSRRLADGNAFADALDQCLAGKGRRTRGAPIVVALLLLGLTLAAAAWVVSRDASPSPSVPPGGDAPVEPPGDNALTPAQERQADRELRSLKREPSSEEQVRAASRWLAANPGHSKASEVESLRDRAQLEFPFAKLRPSEGWSGACWVNDERFMTYEVGDVLTVWTRTGESVRNWRLDWPAARTMAAAPGGNGVVLGGPKGELSWFDLSGERLASERLELDGRAVPVSAVAVHPSQNLIAVGGERSQVLIVPLSPKGPTRGFGEFRDKVLSLAISPDGTRLAVGVGGLVGEFSVWDLARGEVLFRYPTTSKTKQVAFDPSGRAIASTSGGDLFVFSSEVELLSSLRRDDAPPKADIGILTDRQAHRGSIGSVSVSPDGKTLYTEASYSVDPKTIFGEIRVWDLAVLRERTGARIPAVARPKSPLAPTRFVDLSPDGLRLLVGTGHSIEIWPTALKMER